VERKVIEENGRPVEEIITTKEGPEGEVVQTVEERSLADAHGELNDQARRQLERKLEKL